MSTIVGVKFNRGGRIYFFDQSELKIVVGDRVMLETEGGPKEGLVAIAPSQVIHSDLKGPLDPILRKIVCT